MSSKRATPRPDGGDPSVRHTTDPHPRVAGQPNAVQVAAHANDTVRRQLTAIGAQPPQEKPERRGGRGDRRPQASS